MILLIFGNFETLPGAPLGGGNKKVIVRPPEFGLNPAQILVATITFLNYPRAPLGDDPCAHARISGGSKAPPPSGSLSERTKFFPFACHAGTL